MKNIPIKTTTQYRKSFKQLMKRHQHQALSSLNTVISILAIGEPLPAKYKPHKLSGVKDTMECHVQSDVLLTYRYENNELILELHLLNLTTHDELDRKAKLHGSEELVCC